MNLILSPSLPPGLLAGADIRKYGFEISDVGDTGSTPDNPVLYILDPQASGNDDAAFIRSCKSSGKTGFIAVFRHKDFDLLLRFMRMGIIDCLMITSPPDEWERSLCYAGALISGKYRQRAENSMDTSALVGFLKNRTKPDLTAFEDRILSHRIPPNHSSCFAVLCLWIKFSDFSHSFDEMESISQKAKEISEGFLKSRNFSPVFTAQNGMLIFAVQIPEGYDLGKDAELLLTTLKKDSFVGKAGIVIGVSSSSASSEDIVSLIHEATRAVHSHSSLGLNRVIEYNSLSFFNPDSEKIFTPEYKAYISSLVELRDVNRLNQEIDRLRILDHYGRDAEMTPLFYIYGCFFEAFLTALRQLNLPADDIYSIQDQYNIYMQDSDSPEELTAVLRLYTTEKMSVLGLLGNMDSISLVKKYIRSHYSERLTRDEAASAVGLHPNYFSSWFKKNTGTGFTEYLRNIRINEAKRLLIGTGETVVSIAHKVGYDDYRHFCRSFRKCTGMTPALFREDLLRGNTDSQNNASLE